MQLLLLLIFQGSRNHSHSFIPNCVTAEVKLTDCLATLKHRLELTQTFNSNVVLFEGKHLQVALLSKGTAQGQGALREDAVAREPDLGDVLGVLEDFGDVASTIRSDEVVGKVELA